MKNLFTLILFSSFIGLGIKLDAQIPTNGLIAWYPFNGNANDASGNGHNGAVVGATLTTDRFGNSNKAFLFDGNDYIQVNNDPDLTPTTSISVSCWTNRSQLNYSGVVVSKDIAGTENGYRFDIYGTKGRFSKKGFSFNLTNQEYSLNQWYHTVCIFDGNSLKYYINGVLDATYPTTEAIIPVTQPLIFGVSTNLSPDHFFIGKIDDIRIYSSALTETEVLELFNEGCNISLNLPDTLMACQQESLVLDAGAGFASYAWSNGASTQTINVSETGTYTVTVTDNIGCSATDSTYINIINVQIVQNDTTICAGESVELSVTGGVFNNITNGLVAWYPFDGNANDASGNGNNGAVNGATLTYDRFGNANNAYLFDGVNDYITVPTSASLNSISQGPITMCCWVNTTEFYTYGTIILQFNTVDFGGGGYQYNIWAEPGAKYNFSNWNHNNGGAWGLITPQTYPPGQWKFLCVTVDPATDITKIFIDGQLAITGTNTIHTLPPPVLLFFGRHHNGGGHYHGIIDDIRYYSRVISESEIAMLYNEGAGSYSYLWSTGETTPSIMVSPTQTTTYYVEISDGINTCTDSVKVTVNNINLNLPDTLMACQQESLVLDAGAGFASYAWSTGASTQTINVSETGTYTVTVTDNIGCSATDSIYANIINVQIVQNDTTICAGQSVDLSLTGGSSNIINGLAAWFPFNGNANDESGNANNASVYGPILTPDRFGLPNRAFYFDGNNDYMEVGTSASLNSISQGSVTLSCWVKPVASMGTFYHFRTVDGSGGGYSYDLSIGNLQFTFRNWNHNNPGYIDIVGPTNVILGNWYLVSATISPSTNKIIFYINGQYIGESNNPVHSIPPPAFINLGRNCNGYTHFKGDLDDVRLYGRVLSQVEIESLYNEGAGYYNYLWSTGETTPAITVSPSQTTTYYVEISDGINTCADSVKVTVNNINLNLPDTLMACQQESLVLDAGAGFASYAWSTGASTQTISVTETGTYTVTITDNIGCSATDSIYANIINVHIVQNDTTIISGQSIDLSISGLNAGITDGLVGYWPFTGNANDESGFNRHGILNGPALANDRFGNNNCAYSFDGLNDYIEIPSNLANMGISQAFTITFWVKTGPSGFLATLEDGTLEDYNGIYFGFKPSENKLFAKVHTVNGGYYDDHIVVPNYSVNWTFLCFQYTGSQMKIWLNDQLVYTHNVSGNLNNGNRNLRIGFPSGEQFYNGIFDDLRIYNRVLSLNEISSLINENNQYSYLWSTGETTPSITVSPTQTTTYYVEISDGINTCVDSVTITVANVVNLQIKAGLEGPYFSGQMTPFLNVFGYLPLSQPYNTAPWNYNGTESVSGIPNGDIIDWVLLELRETPGDASTATSNTKVGEKAAFILRNGSVVGTDGVSNPLFSLNLAENLYVVLWHRNHLGITSNYPLVENNGIYAYDFRISSNQAYGGALSQKQLTPGTWVMIPGDGNADGQISNADKNDVWKLQTGLSGYWPGDFNMNGQVDNTDKNNYWRPNSGRGSQVPE